MKEYLFKRVAMNCEDVVVSKNFLIPNQRYETHKHDFVEITMVLGGEACQKIEGKKFFSTKNDLILLPGGISHSMYCTSNGKTPENYKYIELYLSMEFATELEEKYPAFKNVVEKINERFKNNSLNFSPIFKLSNDESTYYENFLHWMFTIYKKKEENYQKILKEMCSMLISIFERSIFSGFMNVVLPQQDIPQNVMEYISKHYCEEIRLSEMAKMANLSVPTFSKRFMEKYGISFPKYIHKCRIELSTELLKTTILTVTEISLKVGYRDVHDFYKYFRIYNEMTPTELKKTLEKDT